ncbi:MAG: hypothetical protein ACEPOZ_20265 [Marinifilaceae bacterium]
MSISFKRFFRSEKLFDVLLIFLGITLSMQFDNWNDERKLRKKETAILSSLYADVVADSVRLVQVINGFDKYYVKPLTLLDSCLQSTKAVDLTQLHRPLKITMGSSFMDNNKGAYECFKYEGVALVKNSRLKVKLFDYYEDRLSWLDNYQKLRGDFQNNFIFPVALKYGDSTLCLDKASYLQLRRDAYSCSLLSKWKAIYASNREEHQKILPILLDLKHELEKELRQKGKDPHRVLVESDVLLNENVEQSAKKKEVLANQAKRK